MPDAQPLAELTRTQAAIRRGMAEGLHTGAQLFASIAGQPVADLALGDSREATILRARFGLDGGPQKNEKSCLKGDTNCDDCTFTCLSYGCR